VIKNAAFLLLMVIGLTNVSAQQISVHANEMPLNKVLIDIRDTYDIHFSFDDKLLSKYSVTIDESFDNPESALRKILLGFPLNFEKSGTVFVIYSIDAKKVEKLVFRLAGQVLESGSNEPLPYSHVIINGNAMATDLKGSFSYLSNVDSIFSLQATQLGYYILDTIIGAGTSYKLFLIPSLIGLTEVVIIDKRIEKSTQIGEQAGLEKLNHKVANYLPGYGDNSVYNLLRLQPGILASGESTSEPVIWGGYAGQSKVMFDGFTIYGLKNFNDNISTFNPFMAKDIEVLKGGYDARYGERVAGIVNISGKNGNREKTGFEFCINNMTLNGMLEVPVANKGSLMVSFRQTYYNLYDPWERTLKRNNGSQDTGDVFTLNVVPDYVFRDLNLKYSTSFNENDLFYISLYGGSDDFSYAISEPISNLSLLKDTEERMKQAGASAFYGRTWLKGNSSNFSLSWSGLQSEFSDNVRVEHDPSGYLNQLQDRQSKNGLDELTARVDNHFVLDENQALEFGGGFMYNQSTLVEDTFGIKAADIESVAQRTFLYIQNVISNPGIGNFKVGLRSYFAHNIGKAYLEPRVSASINLSETWKLNAAWGIYNQFVVKSSVVDLLGNYKYLWTVSNGDDIPVTHATHYLLGTAFHKNDFTFSLEGFFKNTTGLTRFIRSQRWNIEGIFDGKSRSYGFDVMLKKEYRGHQAWIAYTLSKVEEHFDYQRNNAYRRAPQDQRNELKLAALFNLDPFYISANYVFGSGFPAGIFTLAGYQDDYNYSRLDASIIFKFLDRKLKGEVGLSILNVLNTQNLKYENFEIVPAFQTSSINIYTEAIPFTPTLFLKLSL
jgi:hypothetical protein